MSNTIEPGNEDSVQCYIYSIHHSDLNYWKSTCQEINKFIKSSSKDYIWHRDEFQVFIPLDNDTPQVPQHLCGNTYFGENIEDEWFIVHLLFKISKLFTDLIIQVMDNDGDFLLIEAADYLPIWANPETTENRVFIFNNQIHIIPPEVINLETKVMLETSLKTVMVSPELTQAPLKVQQAISNRIGIYPEKVLDSIHNTPLTLPTDLAALLILKPSLIAPIVDAYCNHDNIDVKCCKSIDFTNCVTVDVKFTKFLYATLIHSKLINDAKKYAYNNDKKIISGLKLKCGFQMIMNKASADLYDSKDYHKFINNLKRNGYFKNNIEGSKYYTDLLEKANEYYKLVESPVSAHLSHDISQLMLTSDYISIKDSIKEKYLADSDWNGDNEDWLNIHPDQLNDLLQTRYGKATRLKSTDIISAETVTTELSSFLKQTSDFEGIEADRDDCDEDIEFESDKFVSCIENMLNILSMGIDKDVDKNNVDHHDEDNDDELTEHSDDDYCDLVLKAKLKENITEDVLSNETILKNIVQSMKEEKSSTGPTSNLLRNIGIHKSKILDSDDDVD